MSEFFVGQKVVAIPVPPMSFSTPTNVDIGDRIVVGKVYEIRSICMANFVYPDGMKDTPACRLVGFNRISKDPADSFKVFLDQPLAQFNFRPVQSKWIEVFRRIARDVTEGKRVRIDA